MTSRASKRTSGAIRNIAKQLAQIATGWEASFDGPLLLDQPRTGSYIIDLVRRVGAMNGHDANLGMMTVLDKWVEGELGRLKRNRDWLSKAVVEVDYELIQSGAFMDSHPGFWTSEAFVATLSAAVLVATHDGVADASFRNTQALIGPKLGPGRPVPEIFRSGTSIDRPFQIKRKGPGRPSRKT